MVLLSMTSSVFYLIGFQLKSTNGSLVENTIFSEIAEFISKFIAAWFFYKFGPRHSFSILWSITLFGSILLLVFWTNLDMIPYLVLLSKCGCSGSFSLAYLGSMNLIPTIFSSSLFGFSNCMARGVTMVSPLIAELPYPVPNLIIILASGVAIATSQLIITNLPNFQ